MQNNLDKEKDLLLVGKRFGKLIVLERSGTYKNKAPKTGQTSYRALFKCRCDCGIEEIKSGTFLRRGKSTMCKSCCYKNRPQSLNKYSSEERLYNLSIVQRCKRTKIKNLLSLEEFCNIINKNCYYCNSIPTIKKYLDINNEINANGIDRLDSSKDYILENCVPCCKQCNISKSTLSEKEFLNQIKKIYEFKCLQEDIIKEN